MDKPLIAIIGSEGWLGRALRSELQDECDIRRVDVACPNVPGAVRADVRSQEGMERAVDGASVVVHLAAYHGGYCPPPTDETRFDVNVAGTFRMFQACVRKGVRRVVWASSMAALSKGDIYSITKVIGEDLCDFYRQRHGFSVAMMRYGSFTPCDLVFYGQRLLRHGVDVRDCVAATCAAARRMLRGQDLFGRYTVMPIHPYPDELRTSFGQAWPATSARAELARRYRIELPASLPEHDLAATVRDLEFVPRYNFETFLDELAARDAAGQVTPGSPRWHFEQGVPPPPAVVWPPCGALGG